MRFLGTNFGHDAAAALIDSTGALTLAVEEGRLLGEKNVSVFPDLAVDAVLNSGFREPVHWQEGWNWPARLWHKGLLASARFGALDHALYRSRAAKEWERYFEGGRRARARRSELGRPTFTGHHRAHALSLVPWGLPDQSLVLVSDTTGERESVSSWYWSGGRLDRLTRSDWPHSPGSVLHQAAYHLGFPGERGPGKLMALAAWGDATAAELPDDFANVDRGEFRVNLRRFPAYRRDGAWRAVPESWARDGYGRAAELVTSAQDAGESGADFAAVVQHWFEDALMNLVDGSLELLRLRALPVRGVGLAGGAALNCQANGRLIRHLERANVATVTVSPWSNDAGTAIGAAVAGAMAHGVRPQVSPSALLGPGGDATVGRRGIGVNRAVDALIRGEVIGLVSGGVEFGPRALGARCLLADASRGEMKERLNEMKGRPNFMPLAPATLRDMAGEWFSGDVSTNMAWTVPYTQEAARRFPAITHPSGETRAQAVSEVAAPLLHRVLTETTRAGAPILLLTSLNGAGEPMLANGSDSVRSAAGLGAAGCLTDTGWVTFA